MPDPVSPETTAHEGRIFIDADACPVKDETYKVAARYGLKTFVVSNSFIQIPRSEMIERQIVDAGPDVADDWIAENVLPGDIVVTNDIPLADRSVKKGALVITPRGRWYFHDLASTVSPAASRAEAKVSPPRPR